MKFTLQNFSSVPAYIQGLDEIKQDLSSMITSNRGKISAMIYKTQASKEADGYWESGINDIKQAIQLINIIKQKEKNK